MGIITYTTALDWPQLNTGAWQLSTVAFGGLIRTQLVVVPETQLTSGHVNEFLAKYARSVGGMALNALGFALPANFGTYRTTQVCREHAIYQKPLAA